MDYKLYIEYSNGHVTCTSPTPELETMSRVTYPISLLNEAGNRLIQSSKSMAVKKLISLCFAEIIITAILTYKEEYHA